MLEPPASDPLEVWKAHDARDAKAPPVFEVKAPKEAPNVVIIFAYEGGKKIGAGGTAMLYIDGEKVGEGKINKTQCCIFSASSWRDGRGSLGR